MFQRRGAVLELRKPESWNRTAELRWSAGGLYGEYTGVRRELDSTDWRDGWTQEYAVGMSHDPHCSQERR